MFQCYLEVEDLLFIAIELRGFCVLKLIYKDNTMKNEIATKFNNVKNSSLNVSVKDKNDIFIAILNGSIDTYNSDFFAKKIEMVKDTDYRKIVIDLTGISYISSTGMGALIQILKIFTSISREVVLSGITPKVMEIFKLLGFNSFFKTYDTLDEAIFFLEGNKKPTITQEKEIFPKIIQCVFCGQKLKAIKSGKFRCPKCSYLIVINTDGKLV